MVVPPHPQRRATLVAADYRRPVVSTVAARLVHARRQSVGEVSWQHEKTSAHYPTATAG